jgi:hypothetical protein
MATNRTHPSSGARRRVSLFLLPAVALAAAAAAVAVAGLEPDRLYDTSGTVARVKPTQRPSIQAAFPRESYAPGKTARLRFFSRASNVRLQLFRAGTELGKIAPRDVMRGTPVTPVRRIGTVSAGRSVWIRIGDWPSGLYFARVTGAGSKVGYAPFVLRPRRLGESRVALVLPTFTWQAYNFRDDDGDGGGDTWYADQDEPSARIGRPYENRGVPPHYKYYDQPFIRWLIHTGRHVDVLSDSDLHATNGRTLARAYDLIIFSGHHEYVTGREFDATELFRDLGGNLMFLSANNFYWRVDRRGDTIVRVKHWRELGRPEAALIGVQYIGNDDGRHRGPWIVRDTSESWLFSGLGLRRGSAFANGGIEIDKTAPSSPRGTKVLAEIPNLLGPGMTGQMTYYETPAGAKVFAAGAFTLAGAVWWPEVNRLMENLWAQLARD